MLNILAFENVFKNEYIAKKIDYYSMGFDVKSICKGICDAKLVLEKLNIDVVISTSISSCTQLKSINPNIKFILINCDYNKIKKSSKFNNFYFVNVNKGQKELKDTLIEITDKINKENFIKHTKILQYSKAVCVVNNSFFDSVKAKNMSSDFVGKTYYILICIEKSNATSYKIFDDIRQFIGQYNEYLIIPVSKKEYAIVANENLMKFTTKKIDRYALELKRYLVLNKIIASVIVGNPVYNIEDIYLSKESALKLKEFKFYQKPASVIINEDLKAQKFCTYLNDKTYVMHLVDTIIHSNSKNIINEISLFFEDAINKRYSLSLVNEQLFLIYSELKSNIVQYKGDINLLNYEVFVFDLEKFPTIFDLHNELLKVCLELNEYFLSLTRTDVSDVVVNIIDYTKKNYFENLNLAYFANKYFINRAYLGQIFKKTIGIGYNDYLMKTRICEAKKMLLTQRIKVCEVAQRVGYKDSNYFCVKFLNSTGLTPSKYREEKKAQ